MGSGKGEMPVNLLDRQSGHEDDHLAVGGRCKREGGSLEGCIDGGMAKKLDFAKSDEFA